MSRAYTAWIVTGMIGAAGAAAGAGVVSFEDPGIWSPFDNAQVEVVWEGSSAGYTGNFNWTSPELGTSGLTLWTNKSATPGQSFVLPTLYQQGQRVDFSYQIIAGGLDTFSTALETDWSQFKIDASDPTNVRLAIEDIRYPSGDMDYNDAVLRVVFSQTSVPTPGGLALLGGGCVLMLRRKR